MNKNKKVQDKAPKNSHELLLKNEIIGIVFLFISIFFIFSVISYTPSDPSFFNSFPGRHSGMIIVFDIFHFRDQVSHLNELRRRIAAGEDYLDVRGSGLEHLNHLVHGN